MISVYCTTFNVLNNILSQILSQKLYYLKHILILIKKKKFEISCRGNWIIYYLILFLYVSFLFFEPLVNCPERSKHANEEEEEERDEGGTEEGTNVLVDDGAARVSIQLQRWISCLGGYAASNDREEIVTVRYSPHLPSLFPLHHSSSLSLFLASATARRLDWEDSGVSVTIGWEWCTNTIHLLSGVPAWRVGRTVKKSTGGT